MCVCVYVCVLLIVILLHTVPKTQVTILRHVAMLKMAAYCEPVIFSERRQLNIHDAKIKVQDDGNKILYQNNLNHWRHISSTYNDL